MSSFDWNTPPDWPSPRESWSPALDDGKKKVRLLLSLIPAGLYVKTEGFEDIVGVDSSQHRQIFAFIVSLPGYEDQSSDWSGHNRGQVFISADGVVRVTPFIRKLLQGKVQGFEEWDRWPWPTEQPPDPPGYNPRKIKVYP